MCCDLSDWAASISHAEPSGAFPPVRAVAPRAFHRRLEIWPDEVGEGEGKWYGLLRNAATLKAGARTIRRRRSIHGNRYVSIIYWTPRKAKTRFVVLLRIAVCVRLDVTCESDGRRACQASTQLLTHEICL